MQRELDRIGYTLKPLDTVLVNTAAGTAYGQPNFLDRARAAAWAGRPRFCCASKARASPARTAGAGTRRFLVHRRALPRNRRPARLIWEGHKAGRDIAGYCHMAKLDQSRGPAAVRLRGVLLSGEDRVGFRRLDAAASRLLDD